MELPIVAYANFKTPFYSLYLVVVERDWELYCTKPKKAKKVISYASRSISKSKKNYQIHRLECLALKWAITDRFHQYLFGAQFKAFTDNDPLAYVLTTVKLDARSHRWVAALSNYTFSIIYKLGRNHQNANALSRIQWLEVKP